MGERFCWWVERSVSGWSGSRFWRIRGTYTLIASMWSARPDFLIANSMTLRTNLSDQVSSDLPSHSCAALLSFWTFFHSFSCSAVLNSLGPNAASESWSMYWPT
jgi:hypothetical protein